MLDTIRNATRQRGASAVEYSLLVALIAAVIVVVVFLFGSYIRGFFDDPCDEDARRRDSKAAEACDPR